MLSTKLIILSSLFYDCSSPLIKMHKNDGFMKSSNIFISNTSEFHKIGVVDFRYILKKSNAMKILGNKFLLFEKKINEKFKLKQIDLKKKEKMIKKNKTNLTKSEYKKKMQLFKEDVFKVQKFYKNERSILNKSFQKIQKKLKDLLAQAVKNVSIEKKINVVFLKENIFLFNNSSVDLTSEVLDRFNRQTKSLKITITPSN
mgnify:CR=1 FL=1